MSVEVGRSFDELQAKVKKFNEGLKMNGQELWALNSALQLNPGNIELINQKYGVFATQLETSRDKASALQNQMSNLKQELDDGTVSQEYYEKQNAKLAHQLTLTNIEVVKLEGVIKENTKIIDESTKALEDKKDALEEVDIAVENSADTARERFVKSQKELQRELRNTQRSMMITQMAMRSVTSTLTGLGLESDAVGQQIQNGMQTALSGVQAIIAINGQFIQAVNTKGFSMQGLAFAATAAFASFSLVDGLLNKLPEPMRRIAGIATAVLAPALAAIAIKALAANSALTFGTGAAVILAATAAGIAGLRAAMRTGDSSDSVGGNSSTSPIRIPPPPPLPDNNFNRPTSGGSSQNNQPQQVIIANLGQLESAMYRSGIAVIRHLPTSYDIDFDMRRLVASVEQEQRRTGR